jgi:protein-S-isoprenylcysteine O-methyltransferase Ste14
MEEKKMNTRVLRLYILDQILSLVGMGVALFWSSGRMDWWPAWAVIAIWLAWFVATDSILLRTNPDLMAERLSPPRGAKSWDRAILSILRLTQLARYILAGLDQRYGWTGDFSLAAQITGLAVGVLGHALFGWAMVSNTFFSQVVRIQSERGHIVIIKGPYRFLRHPSYFGGILFELGLGILLDSWWALLAGIVCAILLILRTALEDRTLLAELTGYQEYARQVRYRLIPGIW